MYVNLDNFESCFIITNISVHADGGLTPGASNARPFAKPPINMIKKIWRECLGWGVKIFKSFSD